MSKMVGRGSKYTDEDRKLAVVEYVVTGNLQRVSDNTGIPLSTVHSWSKLDWWETLSGEVRSEKSAELDAKMTELIDISFEQAKDRVLDGDFRVGKDGKLLRVPMSGRDLVIAGATVYDKQRLHRNQPTSIRGDGETMESLGEKFKQLSRQWEEKQVNVVSTLTSSDCD